MLQLSQKYKSSADLVSELLRKPVFTRYRSIKKKSCPVQKPSSEVNSKLAVIRADNESSPVPPLVSQSQSQSQTSCDVEMVEVQMVSPVTLKPRIETVNPGRDFSHTHDSPQDDEAGFEVKQSKPEPNTNSSSATNNTTNNRAITNNADTVTSSSNVSLAVRGERQ